MTASAPISPMTAAADRPAFRSRDILSISELSRQDMLFVMDCTRELVRNEDGYLEEIKARIAGQKMYYAFFEPSTRTRFSFYYAARGLGLQTVGFSSTVGTSTLKGEPLKDTLMMVQGYGADVIVQRHPLAGAAMWGADNIDVPIVNAGDGAHEHPTQTLLDLYSILKIHSPEGPWGHLHDLGGLTLSFVGDLKYGRTVHSLTDALSRFRGVRLNFVAPPSLQIPGEYLEALDAAKVPYQCMERFEEILPETDILYMTRIQRERFPDEAEYQRVKRAYHLSARQLEDAPASLRVMHPLPRNKENLELDFDVDDTDHAYYYKQAEHGLAVRQTVLALVTGGIKTPIYRRHPPRPQQQQVQLHPLEVSTREGKPRPQYLFEIDEGTVIDHIPPGRAELVKHALKIPKNVSVLTAENLESRQMPEGRKDLIKIIGFKPSASQLNEIALVAPDATVVRIGDSNIVEKGKVVLPEYVRGLLVCPNRNCISRPEHLEGVTSLFENMGTKDGDSKSAPVLRCYYCDQKLGEELRAGNDALREVLGSAFADYGRGGHL